MSTMSQRSHLTDSEAWRAVGRLEGGQTQAEVAQAIGVSQSAISRIWNRFLETGSAGRRQGQDRRRATTFNEDGYLVLTARRHRNMNTTLLQQHLHSATGTTVSTQTVRNRLHGVGLYARRPMRWGVLVYGGISIDGRTYLYIIRDGPLTARRYRDEILRPIVVPYAAAIGDDFILMDDNCRPHRANLVEVFIFRGRNRTNGMSSVFCRHESNRALLGRSRKTSSWPATTPTNSPRFGRSSSGRVGQNTPTRD
ncbi:transposable element Tcb2 transposase [Trichonephila clavipes]|nr:transposable element Tcb2 transposase [Trichonephila clavipes]